MGGDDRPSCGHRLGAGRARGGANPCPRARGALPSRALPFTGRGACDTLGDAPSDGACDTLGDARCDSPDQSDNTGA